MKFLYALAMFAPILQVHAAAGTVPICAGLLFSEPVEIVLHSEWHGSPAADKRINELIGHAKTGKEFLFFESIPREANTQPKLKNEFLKGWQIPVNLNTLKHVFGMDHQLLQLQDIAAGIYLSLKDGQHDPSMFIAFAGIMSDQRVRRFLDPSHFSPESARLFRIKNIPALRKEIERAMFDNRAGFMKYIFELEQAADRALTELKIDHPKSDLLACKGTYDEHIDGNLSYRDNYMAESVFDQVLKMKGVSKVNVSIGKFHAPGILRRLRELLPNLNIRAIDVDENDRVIEVDEDFKNSSPPGF